LLAMRAALNDALLRIRDTGFLPEPMMIAAANGSSPTVVAADDSRYPLRRLIGLLDAIQLGDSKAEEMAAAAADDPLPAMRYWAAVAALRGGADYAERLLGDSDPVVRVTAAEALLRSGEHAKAMQVMEAAVEQVQLPELRMFALDGLTRTPRVPSKNLRPLLGQLSAYEATPGTFAHGTYLARLARVLLVRGGGGGG